MVSIGNTSNKHLFAIFDDSVRLAKMFRGCCLVIALALSMRTIAKLLSLCHCDIIVASGLGFM